jgi:phage tail protein X
MANRYLYTKQKKDFDTNESYYESTIYPKIKPSDSDLYIISEAGDRLDLLAKKYYGNTNMWWIIAVVNNLNDANFFVPEGRQLVIPTNIQTILSDLEKINK